MDYAQELELKRAHVYNCLTRIGGQTLSSLPITGAEQIDGYRNKVQFPVQEQNGKPVAGFFAGKTHTVIPAAHCRIQPDCAERIRAAGGVKLFEKMLQAFRHPTLSPFGGYISVFIIQFSL